MTAVAYLKKELDFPLGEWRLLDKSIQDWYKEKAKEEMKLRGIQIDE